MKKKKLSKSSEDKQGIIIKLSKSRKILIVDQGRSSGITKGMRAYIVIIKNGKRKLLARGVVIKVKGKVSLVKITKKSGRFSLSSGLTVLFQ